MHNHLPSKIQVNFKAYEDQDRAPSQLTDVYFSDKCRGFLLLEFGSFDFIVIDVLSLITLSGKQANLATNKVEFL